MLIYDVTSCVTSICFDLQSTDFGMRQQITKLLPL